MANLTIKQLRYFEALARHRHFGRAAEASAISQPALSGQIKELETTLGTPLFDRSPRNLRLTAFGEAFAPRARDVLRAIDELGELARVSQDGLSGRLRLGVIPTVAPYVLASLIARLEVAFPGLDLDIRETITPRLLDELNEGRLDAAIVALPVSEPGLTEVALFTEEFVLVRPVADAARPMPSAEQLPAMRLLLLEEGHCFRDQALAVCGLPSARPRHGLDGSSLSTLVQMVGAGLGVTLIPEMAVAVEARAAPVAVGRFAGAPPRRTIGMIWRATTPLSAALRKMAAEIGEALAPGAPAVTRS